ncbi:jg19665, partial [Pararge aegeria aegeria]
KAFIDAYTSVRGEYKRLRTVHETEGGKTWDIVRNAALKELKEKHEDAKLFNEKDEPTAEHLEMLLWAYSPEAARVKKVIPETEAAKDVNDRKRRSSGHDSDDTPSKKKKE